MEAQGYVEAYSYWTFSDIFEENYFTSIPFHGGFGLLNIYGIPKPAYRAYELLHRLGENILPVKGTHETVDVWILKKTGVLQILLSNSALPKHPVKTEQVKIELQIKNKIKKAFIERIDDTHANSTQAWIAMGSPQSLSPQQVLTLEAASSLIKEPLNINVENALATIEVTIPQQGVACITLEID